MQNRPVIFLFLAGVIWTLNASLVVDVIAENPCNRVSQEGSLKVKKSDLSNLSAICDCETIEHLDFKKTPVVRLPDCFGDLDKLKTATFRKSALNRLPEDLYGMASLEALDLSFTDFAILPRGILTIPNLKILNLRGTSITSLPDGLEHLQKIDMRLIDMNKNQQEAIRERYPKLNIYFSSPCSCG